MQLNTTEASDLKYNAWKSLMETVDYLRGGGMSIKQVRINDDIIQPFRSEDTEGQQDQDTMAEETVVPVDDEPEPSIVEAEHNHRTVDATGTVSESAESQEDEDAEPTASEEPDTSTSSVTILDVEWT